MNAELRGSLKGRAAGITALLRFALRIAARSEFENTQTRSDLCDALNAALTVASRWQKETEDAPPNPSRPD
jgi:hypothetical protein